MFGWSHSAQRTHGAALTSPNSPELPKRKNKTAVQDPGLAVLTCGRNDGESVDAKGGKKDAFVYTSSSSR